jgi:hypothetical protein
LQGIFAVLLPDVSDLINGRGSTCTVRVSVMFDGLAKEKRGGICFAFGMLLVDVQHFS